MLLFIHAFKGYIGFSYSIVALFGILCNEC